MKTLLVFSILFLVSVTAYAQTCQVNMVDIRTRRVLQTFTAHGAPGSCLDGLKECRKQIRLQNRYGMADCEQVVRPVPQPHPHPRPVPIPQPIPGQEARRHVFPGEAVYHNSRLATVQGISMQGNYAIRSTDAWGNSVLLNNIARQALAVTSGCNGDICVQQRVFRISTAREATTVGLHFHDRFVLRTTDSWGNQLIVSEVPRNDLAVTQGCVFGRWATICVGNQVIDTSNRYGTVMAIQLDGRVVLRTTDHFGNSMNRVSVDPAQLVVTR
jgi:hypothetical protein